DRRAGVDYELPRIREPKDRARHTPQDDHQHRHHECPGRANCYRRLLRELAEELVHRRSSYVVHARIARRSKARTIPLLAKTRRGVARAGAHDDLWLRPEGHQLLLLGADVSPWAVLRRLSAGLLGQGADRNLWGASLLPAGVLPLATAYSV